MKIFLTRVRGGRYMFTALPPIRARIRGTPHEDMFERIGEPIAVKHLCPDGVKSFFGVDLQELETVRVEVTARILKSRHEPESLSAS